MRESERVLSPMVCSKLMKVPSHPRTMRLERGLSSPEPCSRLTLRSSEGLIKAELACTGVPQQLAWLMEVQKGTKKVKGEDEDKYKDIATEYIFQRGEFGNLLDPRDGCRFGELPDLVR